MDEKQRQRLFLPLIGDDSCKDDIKKYLVSEETPSQWLNAIVSDQDNAQMMIVANRRSLKQRQKMDVADLPELATSILWERETFPLRDIDVPKFRKIEMDLNRVLQQVAAIQSQEESIKNVDVMDVNAKIETLILVINIDVATSKDQIEYITALTSALNDVKASLNLVEIAESLTSKHDITRCPTCASSIDIKAITDKLGTLESLKDKVDKVSKNLAESVQENNALREKIDVAKSNGKAFRDMIAFNAEAKVNIAKAYEQIGITSDGVNELIITNEKKLIQIGEILETIAKYNSDSVAIDNAKTEQANIEVEIDLMNKLDGWLKPDGVIRAMSVKSDNKLDILPCFGDMNIEIITDGSIWFNNRPFLQASKSEQYRIGLALNELISRHYKFPILFADGLDIISDDKFIYNFIKQLTPNYEQVFLNTTKPVDDLADNGLSADLFIVDNGMINLMAEV